MRLSSCWESGSRSATQEFPNIFWNPKIHYRVHLYLLSARPIQSTTPRLISLKSILILSSHIRLGFPNGLVSSGFPTKIIYTCIFSCVLHGLPSNGKDYTCAYDGIWAIAPYILKLCTRWKLMSDSGSFDFSLGKITPILTGENLHGVQEGLDMMAQKRILQADTNLTELLLIGSLVIRSIRHSVSAYSHDTCLCACVGYKLIGCHVLLFIHPPTPTRST
jgi:hypothetical protein